MTYHLLILRESLHVAWIFKASFPRFAFLFFLIFSKFSRLLLASPCDSWDRLQWSLRPWVQDEQLPRPDGLVMSPKVKKNKKQNKKHYGQDLKQFSKLAYVVCRKETSLFQSDTAMIREWVRISLANGALSLQSINTSVTSPSTWSSEANASVSVVRAEICHRSVTDWRAVNHLTRRVSRCWNGAWKMK